MLNENIVLGILLGISLSALILGIIIMVYKPLKMVEDEKYISDPNPVISFWLFMGGLALSLIFASMIYSNLLYS